MSYVSIHNLEGHENIAKALGEMVVAWASAECSLIYTLARVTDMSLVMAQTGYYRIPNFNSRCHFISGLILEWKATSFDREAIGKEVSKLSELAARRNLWVHGDWCASSDHKQVVIFNHRVASESAKRRITVRETEIVVHNKAVRAHSLALVSLVDANELE